MTPILRTLAVSFLMVSFAASVQAASVASVPPLWWPSIQSKVLIVLRGNAPVRFDYTLTFLGSVLNQGSVPLTPSHHSLIAAGNIYQADETAACNTATGIAPHPFGLPIKVDRVNYSVLMPAGIRAVINKMQTDCP